MLHTVLRLNKYVLGLTLPSEAECHLEQLCEVWSLLHAACHFDFESLAPFPAVDRKEVLNLELLLAVVLQFVFCFWNKERFHIIAKVYVIYMKFWLIITEIEKVDSTIDLNSIEKETPLTELNS